MWRQIKRAVFQSSGLNFKLVYVQTFTNEFTLQLKNFEKQTHLSSLCWQIRDPSVPTRGLFWQVENVMCKEAFLTSKTTDKPILRCPTTSVSYGTVGIWLWPNCRCFIPISITNSNPKLTPASRCTYIVLWQQSKIKAILTLCIPAHHCSSPPHLCQDNCSLGGGYKSDHWKSMRQKNTKNLPEKKATTSLLTAGLPPKSTSRVTVPSETQFWKAQVLSTELKWSLAKQ